MLTAACPRAKRAAALRCPGLEPGRLEFFDERVFRRSARRAPPVTACPFVPLRPGLYLDRLPERLVVDGFRLWSAGYRTGDLGHWSRAWDLYAGELGADDGRR